jgi:translation initiation factor IF-3
VATKVRLIGVDGQQKGIVDLDEAKKIAKSVSLDLVEIVANAEPPVVKILNYSKFRYDQAHKARVDRKKQANAEVKEIRFRLKIEPNDYEIKKKKVIKFLESGDKVKVGIMFKGREQAHPEKGVGLLNNIVKEIGDLAVVESKPAHDGRNMTMVLSPTQKKVAIVSQQRQESTNKKLNRLDRIQKRQQKRKESDAKK